jgi:hypothetical protein
VISLNDFQRIQETTKKTNIHETHNNQKIYKQQEENRQAPQKNLKNKLKEIDYKKLQEEKNNRGELDENTTQKLLNKVQRIF